MQSFTNDLFISYRHLDNVPVSGETGWIDDFTAKLKTQLAMKLGYEPKVWRDRRLNGNEYFSKVIMEALRSSKLLISILSPGYVAPHSEWCMKELSAFYDLSQRDTVTQLGDKSRCIKVVKWYLPREKHPPQLQGLLGYDFYERDEESGRPREFSYLPQGDHYQRYLKKIDELAFDLSELLKIFDQPNVSPPTTPGSDQVVYLAEATTDRTEYRDAIRNELLSRGFRVLPDRELPDTAAEYRVAVSENLKQSRLSIHLIGEKFGSMLEGDEDNSIVQIQNELAAQQSSESHTLARLIWVAPDLVPTGKRQPAFIELLRSNEEAQSGAELLERPFEELKTRIIEKLLAPKPTPAQVLQFPEENLVRIYLMCDKLDFAEVEAIRDYLYDRDYEVKLTAREGEATQVIEYHKDNLLECDAALIYYGNGNEFWLHSKLSDLRKVRAWGREQPLLKAIYRAGPPTPQKQDYKTREVAMLEPPAYEGLSRDALDQFIELIEHARADQLRTGSGGAR
jgi:TIR domain